MKLLIVICAITCSSQVFSWGQTGHRVTGEIAEQYLSEKAKKSITEIIGTESLAEMSTYADEQRSNPEEFWQEVAGPFHYVTVPEGKHYHEVGAPPQGDAYSALANFSKIVKDKNASKAEKALALKFIVHIIGDLHQPLHAGNGNDRGGNDVKLEFFWEDSNLHRVWDSGLIDRQQLSYTEWTKWLTRTISDEQLNKWLNPDPNVWIAESTKIRDTIYPKGDRLSWDYNYQHIDTVKLRLKQGGVRIAAYLNELFK